MAIENFDYNLDIRNTAFEELVEENVEGMVGETVEGMVEENVEEMEEEEEIFNNDDTWTTEELFYKKQKLHPLLKCNKLDAMQIVLAFFMRHNLTFTALEDLLILINKLLGFKSVPVSKYFFFKLFSKKYKPQNVFFCKNKDCSAELVVEDEKLKNTCKFCQSENVCDTKKSQNYFVTLPISEQLKEVVTDQLHQFINVSNRDLFIKDIVDGEIYKSLPESGERHKITLTMNTDGVEVFKSSKNSLWPIQAVINELDLNDRFKTKNIMLLGVYYYNKHPDMQLFLKNMMIELKDLHSSGLEVQVENKIYYFDVHLVCGTFDGPAKAAVQNLTQHNGYYSCHYCEQQGEVVQVNTKGTLQVRYQYKENVVLRNSVEAVSNMKEASENDKLVKGNYNYHCSLDRNRVTK